MSCQPLDTLLGALVVPARLLVLNVGTDLVRRHKLLVLVDHRSTERTLEDHDWRKHESRADLDEADLSLDALDLLGLLRRGLGGLICLFSWLYFRRDRLADLVVADPDFAVGEGKAHNVVNERLNLTGALGYAENVKEHLLEETKMWLFVEFGVERKNRPGAFQAVPGEVELFHSVYCI